MPEFETHADEFHGAPQSAEVNGVMDGAPAITPPKQSDSKKGRSSELELKAEEPLKGLYKELSGLLKASGRVFSLHGAMVLIDAVVGLVVVTTKTFSAHCANLFEVVVASSEGGKEYGVIPPRFVAAFLHSAERIRMSLPPLEFYTRMPFVDFNFNVIAKPGYDENSKTYYDGPPIAIADGTELLDKVLATFLWKSTVDRVNFLGLLLTAMSGLHWPGMHPLAAFNGNQPGVGKSLLAKLLALLVDGSSPKSISYSPNDEEFEKQIATRVKAGDNVILIDNAKRTSKARAISSSVLERSITDNPVNYRKLGSNSAIMRTNTMLFCLTMNCTTLSADLARRALPINLEGKGDVRRHNFDIPDLLVFVKVHREALLSELAGMFDRWVRAGQPFPKESATHSVSSRWAATIDAVLQHSGYCGFLTNLDESTFNPEFELMSEICSAHWGEEMTSSGWAAVLVEDILKPQLTENDKPKSDRAQATIVGQLFNRFVGRIFDVNGETFEFRVSGSGKRHESRRYCFVSITDEPRDAAPELPPDSELAADQAA